MPDPSTQETENLALATRFLRALEGDATGDTLAALLHPDVVQHELPNRLFPAGVRRDRAAMLAGAARGATLFSERRSTLLGAVAQGDRVALELDWRGTLAVPVRELPAGHVMRVRLAMFLIVRDGQIVALRNYDCYDQF